MENKNVIGTIMHATLTKKEIIEIINRTFPDEEVGNYGKIVQVETVVAKDGTKMQSVCFCKPLNV